MAGYVTSLVIYDSILFERGHMVRRWADGVERQFTANAILLAPVNKRPNKSHKTNLPVGALKASISGGVDRIGPKHLQTTISVNVPYALAVIYGTGTIFAGSKPYLKLPSNPGFGTRTRHKFVSGQASNNFLMDAASMTARTHPSLRGFGDRVFEQY